MSAHVQGEYKNISAKDATRFAMAFLPNVASDLNKILNELGANKMLLARAISDAADETASAIKGAAGAEASIAVFNAVGAGLGAAVSLGSAGVMAKKAKSNYKNMAEQDKIIKKNSMEIGSKPNSAEIEERTERKKGETIIEIQDPENVNENKKTDSEEKTENHEKPGSGEGLSIEAKKKARREAKNEKAKIQSQHNEQMNRYQMISQGGNTLFAQGLTSVGQAEGKTEQGGYDAARIQMQTATDMHGKTMSSDDQGLQSNEKTINDLFSPHYLGGLIAVSQPA